MTRILIAGVGNLFLGDDAFGIEVIRRLRGQPQRDGVRVEDFGIRGIDLTYALLDGVDLAILVDATRRGAAPGSLYLLEPGQAAQLPPDAQQQAALFSPHEMQPDKVLRAVGLLGGQCTRVLVLGCEPESLGTEDGQEGRIGLSGVVAAAVGPAIVMIESLLDEAASPHAFGTFMNQSGR